jgi:hypothetical protein
MEFDNEVPPWGSSIFISHAPFSIITRVPYCIFFLYKLTEHSCKISIF